MKIVPEFLLRHDLRLFVFVSTPTIDIEPILYDIPAYRERTYVPAICPIGHKMGVFAREGQRAIILQV